MVGVLSLQGDFAAHAEKLRSLGYSTKEVRKAADLNEVSGLVVPGGESSVLLKLLDSELEQQIIASVQGGMPTLVTCAGLILFASEVKNPEQRSLGLLDVGVTRNAYGRQVDSFIDPTLDLKSDGQAGKVEGVFIRAPKIDWVGKKAEVIIKRKDEPVGVKQGNVLGLTFHPELSDAAEEIYKLFLGSPKGATLNRPL
jgi:5'-phosphate synthase pdxT subunit